MNLTIEHPVSRPLSGALSLGLPSSKPPFQIVSGVHLLLLSQNHPGSLNLEQKKIVVENSWAGTTSKTDLCIEKVLLIQKWKEVRLKNQVLLERLKIEKIIFNDGALFTNETLDLKDWEEEKLQELLKIEFEYMHRLIHIGMEAPHSQQAFFISMKIYQLINQPEACYEWEGGTVFHLFATCGEETALPELKKMPDAMVKLLIDKLDGKGRTPLHLAIYEKKLQAAEELILMGARLKSLSALVHLNCHFFEIKEMVKNWIAKGWLDQALILQLGYKKSLSGVSWIEYAKRQQRFDELQILLDPFNKVSKLMGLIKSKTGEFEIGLCATKDKEFFIAIENIPLRVEEFVFFLEQFFEWSRNHYRVLKELYQEIYGFLKEIKHPESTNVQKKMVNLFKKITIDHYFIQALRRIKKIELYNDYSSYKQDLRPLYFLMDVDLESSFDQYLNDLKNLTEKFLKKVFFKELLIEDPDLSIDEHMLYYFMNNKSQILEIKLDEKFVIANFFHYAISLDDKDAFEKGILIAKKNNQLEKFINSLNSEGFSPLALAAAENSIDFAKRLMEEGADANLENIKGKTALDIAIDLQHQDMAKFLILHTDPTIKNYKGRNWMHLAVCYDNAQFLSELISIKTSHHMFHERDFFGFTPKEYALGLKRDRCLKILQQFLKENKREQEVSDKERRALIRIDQDPVLDQLIRFVAKYFKGDKLFLKLLDLGACNAFSFLFPMYLALSKKMHYIEELEKISTWNIAEDLNVEDVALFENWVNNLIWLQQEYIKLHGPEISTQTLRLEQFEVIKPQTQSLKLNPLFHSYFKGEFNPAKVEELLNIFKCYPEGTYLDINGEDHVICIYILENKIQYYDSNDYFYMPPFESTKSLVPLLKWALLRPAYDHLEISVYQFSEDNRKAPYQEPLEGWSNWLDSASTSPNGFSRLHLAVLSNQAFLVQDELKNPETDIFKEDYQGCSALKLALMSSNEEITWSFFNHSAVEVWDFLLLACELGNVLAVGKVLKRFPLLDLNHKSEEYLTKNLPLSIALDQNPPNLKLIDLLFEYGANPFIKGIYRSDVEKIVRFKVPALWDIFLKYYPNLQLVDFKKNSFLDYAWRYRERNPEFDLLTYLYNRQYIGESDFKRS